MLNLTRAVTMGKEAEALNFEETVACPNSTPANMSVRKASKLFTLCICEALREEHPDLDGLRRRRGGRKARNKAY